MVPKKRKRCSLNTLASNNRFRSTRVCIFDRCSNTVAIMKSNPLSLIQRSAVESYLQTVNFLHHSSFFLSSSSMSFRHFLIKFRIYNKSAHSSIKTRIFLILVASQNVFSPLSFLLINKSSFCHFISYVPGIPSI